MTGGRKLLALALCLSLLVLAGSALAISEEEWNIQCVNKTITSAKVYSGAGSGQVLATLPAQTFVRTHTYDKLSGMWRVSFYDEGEIREGYVSATDLTIAIVTVAVEGGGIENVPEALRGDLEGMAEYLNERYPDKTFVVKDGHLSVTDGKNTASEEALTDAAPEEPDREETDPEAAAEADEAQDEEGTESPAYEDIALPEGEDGDGETGEEPEDAEESVPDVTPAPTLTPAPEKKTEKAADTEKADDAGKKAEVTEATPLPPDQYEVPEALKNVAVIGTNECMVRMDETLSAVRTSTIRFSSETKKNRIIAYVKPNSEGGVYFMAEPNPKSRQIGFLKTGTLVGVIKGGSNYSRVYVDGVVGCVKSGMLSYMTVDRSPSGYGYLTVSGSISEDAVVNLLSSTSRGYSVAMLPTGIRVPIWQKKGKYYEIEACGFHGWVSQANITEKNRMDGEIEQQPMEHLVAELQKLTKTVTNNEGTETVWDHTKTYNMHRDPYN